LDYCHAAFLHGIFIAATDLMVMYNI
jgi:hypothetical protein